MHCLIIDDNLKTSGHLVKILSGVSGVTRIHTAVQPYLVRAFLETEPVEIIFTRVRLWNYHVFSNLQYLPTIVFLSGGKDKLTDKPGTVVPYKMREPYTRFDLEQLMRRLRTERVIETPAYFFVRFDGRFHRLFFKDIEMIERMQMNYSRIHTRYAQMLVSGTLTHWLTRLPEDQFVRVSDTLILPLAQARNIDSDTYVYRGREISLTYRFAAAAKKEMEQHSDWTGFSCG